MGKSLFLDIVIFDLRAMKRNRWVLVYALAHALISSLVLYFAGSSPLKGMASAINITLFATPLFALLYGGMRFSDSMGFMELLVVRNVSRRTIFLARWFSLSLLLALAYLAGNAVSAVIMLRADELLVGYVLMVLWGVFLHFLFAGLAFLIATLLRTREVMLAAVLGVWLLFYVFYDLLLLWIGISFGKYPIETILFVLVMLNPLDLVRIHLMLLFNLGDLLGPGGALFQNALGGTGGALFAGVILLVWIFVVMIPGVYLFSRRDILR